MYRLLLEVHELAISSGASPGTLGTSKNGALTSIVASCGLRILHDPSKQY